MDIDVQRVAAGEFAVFGSIGQSERALAEIDHLFGFPGFSVDEDFPIGGNGFDAGENGVDTGFERKRILVENPMSVMVNVESVLGECGKRIESEMLYERRLVFGIVVPIAGAEDESVQNQCNSQNSQECFIMKSHLESFFQSYKNTKNFINKENRTLNNDEKPYKKVSQQLSSRRKAESIL